MKELEEVARDEMALAQADHEVNANRHRSPAPQYKVNDYVYLNIKNLRIRRPCKKLERRQAGPYKVAQVVSPSAVRLHLPSSINVHLTIHVNLLEPAAMNPVPDQAISNSPPIVVDNETEYEVEAIVDSAWGNRAKTEILYRVKWSGYPDPT